MSEKVSVPADPQDERGSKRRLRSIKRRAPSSPSRRKAASEPRPATQRLKNR